MNKTKIIIRKKDVENILKEIKTAPKWQIKKWAEETKKLRAKALKNEI